MTIDVDWNAIEAARRSVRGVVGAETAFTMMLWCVAEAMKRHPKFRSSLQADGASLRTYRHVQLGIAVALPGDTLTTAVVNYSEGMARAAFGASVAKQIELARSGVDQADAATTLVVSNIGAVGMRTGTAAVVSPAVATLVLGEVFDWPVPTASGFEFRKRATLTLSFDHRIINGAGAAEFMNDVRREIERFQEAARG